MLTYNAPLVIGQVLQPRRSSKLPKCKLVDFYINGKAKMMWKPENLADGERLPDMTIEDIYREFWFDDGKDNAGPR